MAESSGGVPENWGRLNGEIARFEIWGFRKVAPQGFCPFKISVWKGGLGTVRIKIEVLCDENKAR